MTDFTIYMHKSVACFFLKAKLILTIVHKCPFSILDKLNSNSLGMAVTME